MSDAERAAYAARPESTGKIRSSQPMTGAEFLESLRDGREVYIYGERVKDVTAHPAFRNTARMIARLYDALHDPKHKDKLLVPTDVGITRMRGHRIEWWLGATLIPTFHPAAALRGRPEVTEQMREDFSLAATVLEEKTAPVSDPEPVQTSMGLT